MPSLDHIAEVALLILLVYLCGCTFGYAAHSAWRAARRQRPAPTVVAEPLPSPPLSAARRLARAAEDDDPPARLAAPDHRPVQLPAPRHGQPDDLRKIKGIGPKTESALHTLGIYHYAQIAAWDESNIAWLEGRVALRGRIRREQWVEQAALLATAIPAAAA